MREPGEEKMKREQRQETLNVELRTFNCEPEEEDEKAERKSPGTNPEESGRWRLRIQALENLQT
jgi:hypothetical protein